MTCMEVKCDDDGYEQNNWKSRERRKAVRARFIEQTIREEVGCRCEEGADVVLDIIAEGASSGQNINTKIESRGQGFIVRKR